MMRAAGLNDDNTPDPAQEAPAVPATAQEPIPPVAKGNLGWLTQPATQSRVYAVLLLWVALRVCGLDLLLDIGPNAYTPEILLLAKFNFAFTFPFLSGLHALQDAARNDRLGSDTYKRLNLGVAAVGLVHLLSCLMRWPFYARVPVLNLSFLLDGLALVAGFRIWQASLKDKTDGMAEGAKRTLRELSRPSSKPFGAAYTFFFVYTVLTSLGLFLVPVASVWRAQFGGVLLHNVHDFFSVWGITRNYAGNLLFQAAALYSLRDAAERDRLDASTFKHLNLGLALMAIAKVACFSLTPRATPSPAFKASILSKYIPMAVVCTLAYLKAVKSKWPTEGVTWARVRKALW